MSLSIITGPMSSGKTTTCIRLITEEHVSSDYRVYMNEICKDRQECYADHNIDVTYIKSLGEVDLSTTTVIIDDAQFFDDYSDYLINWMKAKPDLDLMLFGLDAKALGECFSWFPQCCIYAKTIRKLNGICSCGKLTTITMKIGGDPNKEIEVGSSGVEYKPVCNQCWIKYKC